MYDPRDAAVWRRHLDIPQDPLPFDVESVKATGPEKRRTSVTVIRRLKCSTCRQRVALVLADDANQVMRRHYRMTHGGRSLLCSGSDQPEVA